MKASDVVDEARPLRGDPESTRERIVAAAALEFEAAGYYGTDAAKLARAAGYATGTFYKHFADKRALFLAVYDAWVKREWQELGALAEAGRPLDEIVDVVVEHHRRWRQFRADLRSLVASDATVRRHHTTNRRQQIARLRALAPQHDDRVRAGMLILLVERVCDAIAIDELAALGITESEAKAYLAAELAGAAARSRARPASAASAKSGRSDGAGPRSAGTRRRG